MRQSRKLITIAMLYKTIYLCVLTLLFACSTQTGKDTKTLTKNLSNEISFSKLNISKHWIELTKQDNEWVYFIPCRHILDLKTIDITNENNKNTINCNFGLEGQWYGINKIQQEGDSLCFTAYYPPDSSMVIFSMKYIDKKNNIVQWNGEIKGTFIPIEDTIKYKRITQPCDSIANQ